MLKLAAGVVFYNDYLGLKRCLHSLRHFDHVFCIDGKFATFPSEKELSDDITRDMVRSCPNAMLYDAPNLSETQKRSIYLELARQYACDWLLVIDSDEWVQYFDYTQFKEHVFPDNQDIVFTQLHKSDFLYAICWTPRLLRVKPKMRYGDRHFDLYIDSVYYSLGMNVRKPDASTDLLILYGDDRLREPEYNRALDEYQDKLRKFESSQNQAPA